MSETLTDLLRALPPATRQWGPLPEARAIAGLTTDSRQVQPGDIFVGMPGTQTDGGRFWPQAAERGAAIALVSDTALADPSIEPPLPLWSWPAAQMPEICGRAATACYDCPAQQLSLVGVTGTNGKTTVTHLVEFLLNADRQSTALVGTLYERWPGHSREAAHTTPFAPALQQSLASALAAGCQRAVLEVSSHSLDQQRVWGCQFDAAVWTNLTQDHLDYHGNMEDYWRAKAKLFSPLYLKPNSRAVLNLDDRWVRLLLERWPEEILPAWGFTLQAAAAWPSDWRDRLLWASDVEMDALHTRAQLHSPAGSIEIEAPLMGRFNLANLLAAVGVALHLGVSLAAIQAALPQFEGVPGRVDPVRVPGQDIAVTIDYAHTPDGLRNLLEALRPSVRQSLICVFGCGGDRDRRKRPLMGEIAAELSDAVIVTSDNPRTEDPQQILADILEGIDGDRARLSVEVDRKAAIFQAILTAEPGDTVAIAGKGHETYQILGNVKVHFDDREVARAALQQRLSRMRQDEASSI
ncbi:UDP-N-acetylmuramoyl-L-alanyl-D-glutamate--2,6-diaminopimelate ligase [Synechococcus sp. PCC 7336]|uniref:UDP-N-acetylmuramoyl-L-alanyl-D-glutamate--2, 6-diaminopimelate ligase n=1 Tax=Synechococcus sp. PCC 7336 TaxID=195250 RepID=UPI00034A6F86|nr:UDP-N-acetylmuramoyl-L-alanyl-D-glutamate--2,6-diaminopimelate ligase [Synechococcus sp. PCC 7336]